MKKGFLKKFINCFGSRRKCLLDLEEQFEAIFSNLPVGISYLTPDLRFIRINPFLENITGLKSEELKGKYCYDMIGMYKDDPNRAGGERICDVCGVRIALETGKPYNFTRQLNGNLSVKNIGVPIKNRRGETTGVMEIFLDITDQVRMEERLQRYATELEATVEEKTREIRKSKGFLNNIIESTSDAIFTLDGEGRITYVNQAAEAILGYPHGELFGMAMLDILHPDDRERVKRVLSLATGKAGTFHNLNVTVLAADGASRTQLMSLSPLAADEERNRFVGICKDITREQELEHEKEEFLAVLTHDLKTPLTSILGYSSLILDGDLGRINEDIRQSVHGIQVNAQKMQALVRNFLSAGRMRENQLVLELLPVRVDMLVLECLKNMEPQLRDKGLAMETRFTPNLPRAAVDREHMERVFNNILSNAIKFTPFGGKIEVHASHSDEGFIDLRFTDTGVGIPDAELPLLFEKYYQGKTSNRAKGTGLGLYIAKNIVEAHQGSINVASREGRGTTFTIRLPRMV